MRLRIMQLRALLLRNSLSGLVHTNSLLGNTHPMSILHPTDVNHVIYVSVFGLFYFFVFAFLQSYSKVLFKTLTQFVNILYTNICAIVLTTP